MKQNYIELKFDFILSAYATVWAFLKLKDGLYIIKNKNFAELQNSFDRNNAKNEL
jgi:hypothetical protein